MTWIEYTALTLCSLIFMVGLAGCILPILPGNIIVWLGVLIHKLWIGDDSVSWKFVIISAGLTLLIQVADFLLGLWGARRFGATWKGVLGALISALIGLFLPPPLLWLIIGPIIGAILGELAAGRTLKEGSRAGVGTIVGGILGFALKFGVGVGIVFFFYLLLFFNS